HIVVYVKLQLLWCGRLWHSHTSPPLSCFTYTAHTDIYTLSLHDALPISLQPARAGARRRVHGSDRRRRRQTRRQRRHDRNLRSRDRKSTRLNSSHRTISYAVFCLKKKNSDSSTKNLYRIATTVISNRKVY